VRCAHKPKRCERFRGCCFAEVLDDFSHGGTESRRESQGCVPSSAQSRVCFNSVAPCLCEKPCGATLWGESPCGMPIRRIAASDSVGVVSRRCLTISLTEAQRHGGSRKAVFPEAAELRVCFSSVPPCLCEKPCRARSPERNRSDLCPGKRTRRYSALHSVGTFTWIAPSSTRTS